ncbi:hypothetical protein [Ilyobacter sp.]|uniref:hypothetical protein n=1 Tax=Ilyobacter sp. TaxID=3100343 RepID=UPI00356731E1
MPKIIERNKIKILGKKEFSVKEISKEMNIVMGTLYNNKEKWAIDKKEKAILGLP